MPVNGKTTLTFSKSEYKQDKISDFIDFTEFMQFQHLIIFVDNKQNSSKQRVTQMNDNNIGRTCNGNVAFC